MTIVVVFAAEGLSSLQVKQNQLERATRLFAWTDAMRDKLGDDRPPIEQASIERDLTVIHSQLDEMAFEKAYHTGRAMALEQAIELAMSDGG